MSGTGASRASLPCSTSCSAATEVIALVIDAMRNTLSRVIAGTTGILIGVKRRLSRRAGGGVADVAALLGDAGLLVADPREGGDAVANLLLCRQAKAQPQPRLGGGAVDRPFRPRVEGDPG